MAKINLSYDTKTKNLSVDIDGQEIYDVMSFNAYRYTDYDGDPKVEVSIQANEVTSDSKIKKVSYIIARSSAEIQKKNDEVDGLSNAIANMLGVN